MKRAINQRLRTAASRRGMLVLILAGSSLVPLAMMPAPGIGSAESTANFVMDNEAAKSLQLMLFLHRAEPGPAHAIPAQARTAEPGDGRGRH